MGKRLGQHFLKNNHVLTESARLISSYNVPIIIEIGPGHGELTKEIKNETSKTKKELKIIAIEKDEILARELEIKFRKNESVEIICGDVLKELENVVSSFSENYVIAGNIPYYITGYLLRIIGELKRKPEATVLVIQREVAERIVAQPPKMNLLSACTQIWADPKIICIVPKKDFSPPPKVDSALISLTTRKKEHPPSYYATAKTLFAHPRKTVMNNLLISMEKEGVVEILKTIGLTEKSRPQDLSLENITTIAKIMYNKSI